MTRQDLPPSDEEAERAVLGSVLLSPSMVDRVLDTGLRPEHFYRPSHGVFWDSVMNLRMQSAPIDPITLSVEVERIAPELGEVRTYIHSLPNEVPSLANAPSYADRVLSLAEWRGRLKAARVMQEASLLMDEERWVEAQRLLENPVRRSHESLSPDQWADVLLGYFEQEKIKAIPLPFRTLTEDLGGGLRGGELMLLAGYTSHGKTVLADQILDGAAKEGYRCHLYMTEMTAIERGLRLLARRTGVAFNRLRRRELTPEHRASIARQLGQLPYGCTIVSDWTIDDVYRDTLRSKWDLIVIDLIHGFPYRDERELDYLSKMSLRIAKASTTAGGEGTAVITTAHLNESQMAGTAKAQRPKPSLRSIKGGSSLKQDADFVTFVWLQDDPNGVPTTDGEVWIAKGRNTGTSGVAVKLNPRKMLFEELYEPLGGLL